MYRWALARPVSTRIGAFSLAALGVFSLLRLPVSLLPSVERPRVTLTATAQDRSREELLRGLTEPLEQRLGSLAGVTGVWSETGDGFLRIVLDTEFETDADRLRIDVARRVEGAGEIRPDELRVEVSGGDRSPVVEVALLGGDVAERAEAVRGVLVPELGRVPGAGRVEVLGLAKRHVVVRPRAEALLARGLTALELVERLEAVGRTASAGRARDGALVRRLLVREPVESLQELAALSLQGARGPVPLGDVAGISVEDVPGPSTFRRDGEPGVLVRVFRAPGANAAALAARVRERVRDLDSRTRGGLRLAIVSDRSREVLAVVGELGYSVAAGLLLGTLALRLFLGRWRPTLALSTAIPVSLLGAFAAFDLARVPLDLVSLGGLALAVGMLLDNAIVVLEAIEAARARGEADPVRQGTARIALAVVASTLTTVVVFVPLLYLKGLARAFFGEQALAVVTALLVSLALSLSLTPVLASGRGAGAGGRSRNPGLRLALGILDRALRWPRSTLLLALALTAGGAAAGLALPRRLLPSVPGRALRVDYRLPPDLPERELLRRGAAIEARLGEQARALGATEVLAVQGLGEEERRAEGATPASRGRIELVFPGPREAARALPVIAAQARSLPDVKAEVKARPSLLEEMAIGAGEGLEVVVAAGDEERLEALVARVSEALVQATGQVPRREREEEARGALRVRWDEGRLARLGAGVETLEAQVRAALGPRLAGRVDVPAVEPEIRVEGLEGLDLEQVPLDPAVGLDGSEGAVPLGALARLEGELRPGRIRREAGRPAERLLVESGRVDPGLLEQLLADLPVGLDEQVEPRGEALEIRRSFAQLRLALLLALVLVYLAIAGLYESLLLPFLILVTVPSGLAGGLGLLGATGTCLSVPALLGLVLVAGIVVNNAIVLVDRIERLRKEGEGEEGALRLAVAERYRPILMTTVTTLIGMAPLALLGGDGSELRRALALTVIGGLVSSTLVSVVVVPVLHRWLARLRGRDGAP